MDKFGFYQIGEFKTYSKLEAIELGKKLKIFPKWVFNDIEFSQCRWTKEPAESLDELYRQRAQQIRDRYDYVVVWYSGGADSFNVLNTFLKNNIPVDEIAHCWSYKGDGTYDTYFNEEIQKVAIPNTQQICQENPSITHRVIDQTDLISNLLKGDMRFDWIYHANNTLSPNCLSRSFLREVIPDYRRLIDQGKKVVFVWGSEKPRIYYDNDKKKYFCQFMDQIDNIISPRTQQRAALGEYDELFYWSPESVKIIIKQCHTIKRFLENCTEYDPQFFYSPFGYKFGHSPILNANLSEHGLHTLIYPSWDVNTFQRPKTRSSIFGDRDLWFFKDQNNAQTKSFFDSVKKVKSILSEENVFNINFLNTDKIYHGIKNFLSPRYYLS